MDLLDPNADLSLEQLRRTLIRLEDTIIFALIERAQFARNGIMYVPGELPFFASEEASVDSNPYSLESFLWRFLHDIEKVHARVRRYTSPDEHAFTAPLPAPVLPANTYAPLLHAPAADPVNVNDKIVEAYVTEIVPALCGGATTDDGNYGSAATRDVECLQAISRRIHYGKFIAEAKFRDPATQAMYKHHIRAKNRLALYALLTAPDVEARLLARLRQKAYIYGQDITGTDVDKASSTAAIGNDGWSLGAGKVDVNVVVGMYERWVIPLTKEVEVEYLLRRLDCVDEA